MLPMGKPLLPTAEKVLPYLKRIDESRWYSNAGPLVREYEERIADLFGGPCAAVSSCATGLTAALCAQGVRGKEIRLPSWTFVATANAVVQAGARPYFVDVEEKTWTPRKADVAVAPFGAPVLGEGARVIDAAAAFDAYALKQAVIGVAPVVISTHCTKTFSTGEGGIVLSRDTDLLQRIKGLINHGLTEEREVPLAGFNGKMSEYHAAVGLAELDTWAEKRARWLDVKRRYVKAFGDLSHTTPLSSLSWVGSTFCVRLVGRDAAPVRDYLQARGIMSRKIWGDGAHKYGAYRDYERDLVPVTSVLAKEALFVPFSIDTTEEDLGDIVVAVQEGLECASR